MVEIVYILTMAFLVIALIIQNNIINDQYSDIEMYIARIKAFKLEKDGKMLNVNIVCENEKYMPAYANETDACMDLKVKVAEEVENQKGDKTTIDSKFIKPNETVILGSGIKVSVPVDYVMLMFPRSSTGVKLHCMLSNTTGVIDSGYRDEVKIALTNFGTETICINDGQRVAQFMIIKRPKLALHCVEDNADFREGDRLGGIGSTGV